ncbi:MAG: type VI secretion system tip protein VgrG [Bacteroidales bacterium]|nr:type VI secretion system tip protein VgrG [Bacteroidales bacterium]
MPSSRTIPTTRPATVVTPAIRINGNEIARTFLVDSITVSKEINRIPWAKIVLIDGESAGGSFQASDNELFIPGQEIEVMAGYENDVYTIFKGMIIAHSIKIRSGGGSVLVLECRDKTVKMTVGRKSKYFAEMKDNDILSAIAGTYAGLNPNIEATAVSHKKLIQYDCSDWDFIVARAEANGKFCFADDGQLTVKAPDISQNAVLTLTYGATILEMDAEIDARLQLGKVSSNSWSPSDQGIIEVEANNPQIALNGNLSSNDLAEVIGLDEFVLGHGGQVEEPELQAWADALMLKRQLAKVRGRVKCRGIHTVKPGLTIELEGVGERFNGKAYVSGVQHFISGGDWQLDIQFGCDPDWFTGKFNIEKKPASGLMAAVQGLHIAKVLQLAGDPDGEDRIKVHLPILGSDQEGLWARIASLDAGNNRGSFFRPEIDDEVIVGFINDDPRDAIVLGMLNSSRKPAPLSGSDDNHEKGFVTRSGIKMIFNDDEKSFTLETPGGKKILVDDSGGEIQLQDENQNKIAMNSTGISIESIGKIELKAGQGLVLGAANLELKAQAGMTLEGGASTELKAGGVLIIQGSLVQIN